MKLKNKKGSHVEEIISFVFFVGFVVFLIFFLREPNSNKNINDVMDILENSINNKTTEKVTKVYLTNSSPKTIENCISIDESFLEDNSQNQSVIGEDNLKINSKRENKKIYIDWADQKRYFLIYYSRCYFNNTEFSDTTNCQAGDIKTVLIKKEFIEEKIINLINQTSSNYSLIKNELGVSLKYDFNFQFEYENKTKIGKNVSDINTNIYVKENLINYIDSNANERAGKIIIYIW